MRSQTGFTMLEMMLVVGITGTVASLAIPAYGDYVARAQVVEAVQLVSGAKGAVTEHYANTGAWPESLSGVALEAGRYTEQVELTAGAGSTEPAATLTARLAMTGVQADLRGKAIELATADGGQTWTCHSSEIEQRHLPRSCQD